MRPRSHIFLPLSLALGLSLAQSASAADALFWAQGNGGLYTTPLASPAGGTLVWNVTSNDLVFDRSTSQFFWGEGTNVMRGNADGSGTSTFVSTDGATPVARVALDPVGKMVYWASYSGTVKILRAPTTGGAPTVVASPTGLRGIAVDPRPGKRMFYYVDGGVIHASPLDGTPSFTALPNTLPGDIMSVAVDTCANQFVAIGQTTPHPGVPSPFILSADLADAGNQATLFSGSTAVGATLPVDDAAGIVVDSNHGKIYWTTHNPTNVPQIRSGLRNGSGTPTVLVTLDSITQWIRGVQFSAPATCGSLGPIGPAMNPFVAAGTLLLLAGTGWWLMRQRMDPLA